MTTMPIKSLKKLELGFLVIYAAAFYIFIIRRSLRLAHQNYRSLRGLGAGWIPGHLNDLSDAQWRNFRGNLPILTIVLVLFITVANTLRFQVGLKGRGMSYVWIVTSLGYLYYLHGACVAYIFLIALMNFCIVKILVRSKYCIFLLWVFNIAVLLLNRIYEGYSFTLFGPRLAFLDNYRGTFRWHICFNFVILRMISFGCDYHWSYKTPHFDQTKHMQRCTTCSPTRTCYHVLQEKGHPSDRYSFNMYFCYLIYAPLYIAGPTVSFNAFAAQFDVPQKNYSLGQIAWYGLRWAFAYLLIETMTHYFHYNAFAISGSWKILSPLEIFIIGYGVLNFMWLKFFLIWRYFRFWSLIAGVEAPENMPRCLNTCHDLETFWKSWHASFNKWLVRYMYIPLGGSQRKLLNVWVIFTYVAIWHDLEWKLLSWAWLTCIFFIPEIFVRSLSKAVEVKSSLGACLYRELRAMSSAVTITFLMVANLVGYVIGPSGISWLTSRLLRKDGLPVLSFMFTSFYVAAKLMFHIDDFKQRKQVKYL